MPLDSRTPRLQGWLCSSRLGSHSSALKLVSQRFSATLRNICVRSRKKKSDPISTLCVDPLNNTCLSSNRSIVWVSHSKGLCLTPQLSGQRNASSVAHQQPGSAWVSRTKRVASGSGWVSLTLCGPPGHRNGPWPEPWSFLAGLLPVYLSHWIGHSQMPLWTHHSPVPSHLGVRCLIWTSFHIRCEDYTYIWCSVNYHLWHKLNSYIHIYIYILIAWKWNLLYIFVYFIYICIYTYTKMVLSELSLA